MTVTVPPTPATRGSHTRSCSSSSSRGRLKGRQRRRRDTASEEEKKGRRRRTSEDDHHLHHLHRRAQSLQTAPKNLRLQQLNSAEPSVVDAIVASLSISSAADAGGAATAAAGDSSLFLLLSIAFYVDIATVLVDDNSSSDCNPLWTNENRHTGLKT